MARDLALDGDGLPFTAEPFHGLLKCLTLGVVVIEHDDIHIIVPGVLMEIVQKVEIDGKAEAAGLPSHAGEKPVILSGAGRTFETWPEILDNVIPYIGGEEEKSEQEPLKLWGHIEGNVIKDAEEPHFTAQCLRVPVSDGHTAAVFVRFKNKPTKEEILDIWKNFSGVPQELKLPMAPEHFLNYFDDPNLPQPKLQRNLEKGMAVSIGRLREDTQYDYKFVCVSHNTLRGAAGGAVELAELLAAKGYFD